MLQSDLLKAAIDSKIVFRECEKKIDSRVRKRITQDNYRVTPSEIVWEVVYQYFNAEISLAIPQQGTADAIPKKYPIWKHRSNCLLHCMRINDRIENKIFAGQ